MSESVRGKEREEGVGGAAAIWSTQKTYGEKRRGRREASEVREQRLTPITGWRSRPTGAWSLWAIFCQGFSSLAM